MDAPVRILHVDDDPAFGELARTYLERTDDRFAVDSVTRPAEVLDRLGDCPARYDCVVTDYNMPGMNGLELLEAVHARHPDAAPPVVLLAGEGDESIAAEALNAGAAGYVRKNGPDAFDHLAARVCQAVSRADAEENSERFSTLVRALDDPVYVLDEEGRFVYVNDAFLELVGYDRETVLGADPSLVKTAESVATGEDNLARLLSSDGPDSITFEVEISPQTGDPVPCEDHMSLLPYEGAQFRGSLGVLWDISERKAREQALQRRNERFDSFAGVVAHDLRNPLNVAQLNLSTARTRADEAVTDELDSVARALDRMERLLDDLLALARYDETVGDTRPVALGNLARRAWDTVATDRATLRVDTDATVVCDPGQLRQLLENLYRNAVTHAGPGVTVRVLDLEDGFAVADDGPGVPVGERETVFEAGYTTAGDGTGLGLAIVEQVAEAHGWTVSVAESDRGGARFEVRGVGPERPSDPALADAER